jgi:hypothetical protein
LSQIKKKNKPKRTVGMTMSPTLFEEARKHNPKYLESASKTFLSRSSILNARSRAKALYLLILVLLERKWVGP